MGKLALISDIHANVEALTTVLKDIDKQKITEIYCLGDLVGYGPEPREIIREAKNWNLILRGNHEDALLFFAMDFNIDAADAIDWTREELNGAKYTREENHQLWDFLGELSDIKVENDITFLHASPRNHTKEYVRPKDVLDRKKMTEIFGKISRLCFCGHTHEPGIFTEDMKFYSPRSLMNRAKLIEGKKYLINIGSVGQPRDRDTRSCYVVFDRDENTIEYRRLEYDYRKTMEKIKAIDMIPVKFADRLAVGK